MRLARVIGRVTLSRVTPALKGGRWLIAAPFRAEQLENWDTKKETISSEASAIIYDDIGGGLGDTIAYVEGREAAMPFPAPAPVDAYNTAIVDQINYQPGPRAAGK
jgi:carbon dioxide concentrating mechanism protein CcmL